ncbi:helix-turn-helix domain-containing protein [Vibrio nitrifigilis]|uniref:Helix-turn-helix domain-containing protein n=1 Tax=Vibrio nitrifigilis TaxID=2789781 RepID=A0ABS0GCX0_9VIBR|nr:helix-turn-helix domain-containing protein [Vibrio nitrifigilis]MBF9000222.1 helix-turn-helix domain-containing protein [Vibrio nitrifigilis]
MNHIFSTDNIQSKERFDYWNDVVFQCYAPCLGKIPSLNEFNATTSVAEFGCSEISDVTSDAIDYDRRKSDLNLIDRDDIFVSIMTEGSGYFEQNGRQVRQSVGDILIYDSGRPYSFRYKEAYKATLIRLPRPIIQAKVANIDTIGGNIIPTHSIYNRLMRSLVNESHLIATSPELIVNDELIKPALEMMTTALTQAVSTTSVPALNDSHLEQIKSYIRAHLADENLSLDTIAKAQNISTRTLSRLFAETGETPRQWLQSQRLSAAYNALSLGKVRNVTEAAYQFGFKDLSHFSRSFRQRFSVSPKSLIE